jgi:hypothetical protein
MADFNVRDGRQFGFDVSIDGQLVVAMEFRPGLPIPFRSTSRDMYRTYGHLDGVTRESIGDTTVTGVRYRLGGARLRLGDHPYAKELAALGLPKRALLSSSAANVEMSVGDAQEV